jgi:hypothetical protein
MRSGPAADSSPMRKRKSICRSADFPALFGPTRTESPLRRSYWKPAWSGPYCSGVVTVRKTSIRLDSPKRAGRRAERLGRFQRPKRTGM